MSVVSIVLTVVMNCSSAFGDGVHAAVSGGAAAPFALPADPPEPPVPPVPPPDELLGQSSGSKSMWKASQSLMTIPQVPPLEPPDPPLPPLPALPPVATAVEIPASET